MAEFPSQGSVALRTNLADSPIAAALKRGDVHSDIVRFEFSGPKVAHDGFKPMVRDGEFDAGELALVTYLQAKAYGKPLVLLPATMVGRFQHHCIAYNAEHGELPPKGIEGRKVGVRAYSQTTGVWVRGILQHEYGVDLKKVTWCAHDDPHVSEAHDPAFVEHFDLEGRKLYQLMLDDTFSAAILGNELPNDPRARHLIPNPHEAAKRWYAKHGVVPVNHMFVVSAELSRRRPDAVREIYRMLLASKTAARIEQEIDTLPFGIEAVRRSLELAVSYAHEQALIPRRLSVDELFDETTRALSS
jgi:4,5-dihydroxyphthalate decarboxylase